MAASGCKREDATQAAAPKQQAQTPGRAVSPEMQAFQEKARGLHKQMFETQRALNQASTELARDNEEIRELLKERRMTMLKPQKLVEDKIAAISKEAQQVITRERKLRDDLRKTQKALRSTKENNKDVLIKRNAELNEELKTVLEQRRKFAAQLSGNEEIRTAREAAIKATEDINQKLREKMIAARPETEPLFTKLKQLQDDMQKFRQEAAAKTGAKANKPGKPAAALE
jgi:chromosome segregation ATPase